MLIAQDDLDKEEYLIRTKSPFVAHVYYDTRRDHDDSNGDDAVFWQSSKKTWESSR